jgi:hypothetical protein
MEGAVKKEEEVAASSLDTEAAGQDSGYTIAATAHAVDSGLVHMISKLLSCRLLALNSDKQSWVLFGTCRLMAAGGVAAGARLQLRLRAELLQPHDGPPGLGLGRGLPDARRRCRVVRQLAPRRPACRRRTEVHPVQGPHGIRLRYVRARLLFPGSVTVSQAGLI